MATITYELPDNILASLVVDQYPTVVDDLPNPQTKAEYFSVNQQSLYNQMGMVRLKAAFVETAKRQAESEFDAQIEQAAVAAAAKVTPVIS